MLDLLLAHKTAIGQILSVVGATATVVIFQYVLELAWYVAIPAGAIAFVTMPMLWAELLRALGASSRGGTDPPSGS